MRVEECKLCSAEVGEEDNKSPVIAQGRPREKGGGGGVGREARSALSRSD